VTRANGIGKSHLAFFVIIFPLLITGCATRAIQTIPATGAEEVWVTAAFMDMLERQNKCGCCLDAEAEVAIEVNNWLGNRTGTLNGFLQAMAPSHVKFVGVNPLGQPLVIFITDGNTFQNLQVPKNKVYEGPVRSETFKKYMPAWFEPENSFYWLVGRMNPEPFQIQSVQRDKVIEAFWLHLQYEGSLHRNMVLFDPQQLFIQRQVLIDADDNLQIDIKYDNYVNINNDHCLVPGSLNVVSRNGEGKINLVLDSFLKDAEFLIEDFEIIVPSGYKRIRVK
jgi:hypothetical protein